MTLCGCFHINPLPRGEERLVVKRTGWHIVRPERVLFAGIVGVLSEVVGEILGGAGRLLVSCSDVPSS